jgi:hypothetical protein
MLEIRGLAAANGENPHHRHPQSLLSSMNTLPLFVSLATHRLQLRSTNMVFVSTPALCALPFANVSLSQSSVWRVHEYLAPQMWQRLCSTTTSVTPLCHRLELLRPHRTTTSSF